VRKTFNKLVRDKIPEIITAHGEIATVRTLDDDEFKRELIKKLGEEYREFLEDNSSEELADIIEVVEALKSIIATPAEVERIRAEKAEQRGTFEHRIFLEYTDD